MLYCAGNLTRTQATGAGVNTLRRSVHNCLDTLNVGFPSPVGTSVRVRNANAEGNVLTAEIALCHLTAPPLSAANGLTALF